MKILIAHPAQQHSYRLISALIKAGHDVEYATTVYYKKNNLTSFLTFFLKGDNKKKAKERRCEAIKNNKVLQYCELGGLIKLFSIHVKFLNKRFNKIKYRVADSFAKKVAKYAIKTNFDIVITYDDCSPLLFEILKKNSPKILRILDVSSANLLFMRPIYDRDLELAPEFSKKLRLERKIVWDDRILNRATREIECSQYFLVPSKFVMKSLRFSGVKDDQFLSCPYGVDTARFDFVKRAEISPPLKFIFVGGAKELKGISYLLKAFKKISKEKATLTIVGQVNRYDACIKPYLEDYDFRGMVLNEKVSILLKESDVYVFPSLGEGLSLSTLEAASTGLPLIVSENSGITDLMNDGEEGFVIRLQSVEDIVDKITWFISNPDQVRSMGEKASRMAKKYSWDAYDAKLEAIFETLKEIHRG